MSTRGGCDVTDVVVPAARMQSRGMYLIRVLPNGTSWQPLKPYELDARLLRGPSLRLDENTDSALRFEQED